VLRVSCFIVVNFCLKLVSLASLSVVVGETCFCVKVKVDLFLWCNKLGLGYFLGRALSYWFVVRVCCISGTSFCTK